MLPKFKKVYIILIGLAVLITAVVLFLFLKPELFFQGMARSYQITHPVPEEKVNIAELLREVPEIPEIPPPEVPEAPERPPRIFGYIVQFEKDPLVAKMMDLKTEGLSGWDLVRFQQYRYSLFKEHQDVKAEILKVLDLEKLPVIDETYFAFNGLTLYISPEQAKKLKEIPGIKAVSPNYEIRALLMDSVPLINGDDVWNLGYTGQGITIAILDTGIDYNHLDLGGCLGTECKVIGGYDFINDDSDPMDDHGHGTHVGAIAAGRGTLRGVAPDANLLAYKVCNEEGSCPSNAILSAIERAMDPNQDGNYEDHADVISMSLGGPGNPDDPLSQAVDTAVEAGVVVTIAAGNSGPSYFTIESPGCAKKAITVGAQCKPDQVGVNPYCDGNIASFSSRGPVLWGGGSLLKPDVTAPGVGICAAQWNNWLDAMHCVDDEHIAISGTSMATPLVAGASALIKQAHPDWSPLEIKHALRGATSPHHALDADDFTQGFGIINALDSAIQMKKPPIAHLKIDYPYGIVEGIINIKGTAAGENFDRYELTYGKCQGKFCSPTSWKEIGTFYKPVKDGVLATFDTSALERGFGYIIHLVVVANEIIEDEVYVFKPLYPLQSGWPYQISTFSFRSSAPLVADIDNDGDIEILLHYGDRKVYAWHHNGSLVNGWPVSSGFADYIPSTPAAADIDRDGDLEIFVGTSIVQAGALYGIVYAWHHDGTSVNGWPKTITAGTRIDSSPAIGDIDGDGDLEIVIGVKGTNEIFWAWHHDGTLVDGWPVSLSNTEGTFTSPALADLDGDGTLEIIGVVTHQTGLEPLRVFVWNHDGTVLAGWPQQFGKSAGWSLTSPVIGDIDNDGDLEIVAIGQHEEKVYAWHHNGTSVNGWPVSISDYTNRPSPALSDIDSDGDLEIIINSEDGYIYAFHHDGSKANGWPVAIPYEMGFWGVTHVYATPVVGDVDGDGQVEIIAGSNFFGPYILNPDGTYLGSPPVGGFGPGILSTALADLDQDGDIEFVSAAVNGKIYVWDASESYNFSSMHWPMFQRDPQHTGRYVPPLPPIPSITANHRWGSFILTEAVGNLPAGTAGVYWEILDKNNQRQPGYTNFDLLIPGQLQQTREDWQIEEIEYWSSSHKTYLKKWRLIQTDLGVDLLFETVIDDQEVEIRDPIKGYFYEGAVKVFDPANPTRQVGTGMLEQTHDEASD